MNSNVLADDSVVEPVSGNAVLSGIPIEVSAASRLSQIARSIEPPQLLQVTFDVSDMRAIVECMPQSGHSLRSSKRRRQ